MLLFRTILCLGCTLCLMAQSDNAPPAPQQPQTQQAGQAETQQTTSDQEYTGPAILSRGETPAMQTAAALAFRPYIGVSGSYDTGIVPFGATSTGGVPSSDLYGVQLNLGAYTYRVWRHTTLGLDYKGDFRHYNQASYYDGTDQFLTLILTHRPNPHVTYTLRSQVGLYSLNYFLTSALGTADPNYLQAPQNDIYDNRAVFAGASGDLTYNKSARLSFNLGAEGNVLRRQSTALYGFTGATARGDMEYRLTRHTTVGLDYHFTRFAFTRGFGDTNINSIGVDYSTRFTRHLQLSARIGGARLESSSLALVPLDPAVAALLGVSAVIQSAHHLNYAPDIEARLSEDFRLSSFSLSYTNNTVPGNGVYLTSKNSMGMASYSFTGLHYWNFGVDGSYSQMTSQVQTLGTYTSYGAGMGITRQISRSLHAVVRFDARHFNIGSAAQAGSAYRHLEYRVMAGVTFSPGDVPLVLW